MTKRKELVKVLAEITDPEVMDRFFDEIFTSKEIVDFALRWELIKMVKAGIPQREIAQKLGISLCKITRGAKILRDEDSVSNQLLKDYKGDL